MMSSIQIGHLELNLGSLAHAITQPKTQKDTALFLSYLSFQTSVARSKFKPKFIKA